MSGGGHHARPVSPTGDCLERKLSEHDQVNEHDAEADPYHDESWDNMSTDEHPNENNPEEPRQESSVK